MGTANRFIQNKNLPKRVNPLYSLMHAIELNYADLIAFCSEWPHNKEAFK